MSEAGININGIQFSTMENGTIEKSGLMSPDDKTEVNKLSSISLDITSSQSSINNISSNVTSLTSTISNLDGTVSNLDTTVSGLNPTLTDVKYGTISASTISGTGSQASVITFSTAFSSSVSSVIVLLSFRSTVSYNNSYSVYGNVGLTAHDVSRTGFTFYISNASSNSLSNITLYWVAMGIY